MKITRSSAVSGIVRTIDLPITPEQLKLYENGALVQDAFPQLSDSELEFILTGITQEEWAEYFPPENEE